MPDNGRMTTAEVVEHYRSGPASGVFTDGSCSGNPGPGGWGVVRVRDGRVVDERYGDDPATTNNRMEFEAMIAGLAMIDPDEAETVYSDSRLVVQTLNEWAGGLGATRLEASHGAGQEPRPGAARLLRSPSERPRVRIEWIAAHDGARWNEYADALATAYMRNEV